MAMGSLDLTTVALVPGQMVMGERLDMAIFKNIDWNLGKTTFVHGKEGIRMTIVMKRKITSEMMTTYFPSIMLTAITFSTTFFKPYFFEAGLSINNTSETDIALWCCKCTGWIEWYLGGVKHRAPYGANKSVFYQFTFFQPSL